LSKTLEQVRELVAQGDVRVSVHGYEELAADNIHVRDVIEGLSTAVLIEDYPNYAKGPCALALQQDAMDQPVHVLWGIPAGQSSPAVLITAYRPDPDKWDETWLRRKT
jgi:hypothetical protein